MHNEARNRVKNGHTNQASMVYEKDPLKKPLLRLNMLSILFTMAILVLVGCVVIGRFAVWKYALGPEEDRRFEDVDKGVFWHHLRHRFLELCFIICPFGVSLLLLLKNKNPSKNARFAAHLQFQLTICLVTLAMVLVGNLMIRRTPFSPFQLFWVNTVMGLASLVAFAREELGPNYVPKMRVLFRSSLAHAVYQISMLVILLLFADKWAPGLVRSARDPVYSWLPTRHITLVYISWELMTLFNMFNCRLIGHGQRNITKDLSTLFMLVWASLALCHLISQFLLLNIMSLVEGPLLARWFFYSRPLSFNQWLLCLILGASVLIWGQVVLCLPTRWRKNRPSMRVVKPAENNDQKP